jgi:hypothetical protein
MEIVMFQRKAKLKPAALGAGHISHMGLVTFFKAAKEDFERRGREDDAFILEMLEDHFRNNGSTSYDNRIFGL